MTRSENFRFTVPNTPAGWLAITMFRVATRKDNKTRGPGVRRRSVAVYGRLGKDSPHRHLYAQGGSLHEYSSQKIRIEHSVRLDVYSHEVWGTSQWERNRGPSVLIHSIHFPGVTSRESVVYCDHGNGD
jgi:hypothetical protein